MKKIRWWLDPQLGGEMFQGEFGISNDVSEETIEREARQEAFNCIEWGYEEVKEPVSFMEVLEAIDISERDILLTIKNDLYDIEMKNATLDTILVNLAIEYLDTGVANILLNSEWFIN
ncbi:hypothetical protein NSA23_15575 [Anaerosalibacter massiliensis]|uniref:Uncharacterized protein n=1 Tax=Anaerosalibacter massiliensis TaxID=1347392 RepID=A0A9X2ML67_9FIRM|nr:hypothetical protein [Anaerosalibacter massiliensis]MCR2045521.1 hypothetical protein [Anaerosalibacter massiliensis]